MFGTVTKFNQDRGFGFIRGEDGNTYFVHVSKLYGEYLEKGYSVWFKPFANDRSDYNAKDVNVINAPDGKVKEKKVTHKKKCNRKRKPCNADKVIKDNKVFQRFIKQFIKEDKKP